MMRSTISPAAIGLLAFGLMGCPSATTLEVDAGQGTDAASIVDASSAIDVGSAPSWNTCALTSECELEPAGCCDPCGTLTLDQFDAVNAMQHDVHFADVCPAPTPCPRCATGVNPNLVATCAASQCEGADITTLPLSACTADTDCTVRYASCCGCSGTESDVVAIRVDGEGAIEQLLCDAGACNLDCAPRPDPNFRAICDPTTHHCAADRITGP